MTSKRSGASAAGVVWRPMPPSALADELFDLTFAPAPELLAWVRATFIYPAGPLANPDHAHLQDAALGFLWASSGYASKGRRVVGTAEDTVMAGMGSPWKRARAEQQLREWFGAVPRFVITVDAFYWREADDAAACALVEHELYHLAHMTDEFGEAGIDNELLVQDRDEQIIEMNNGCICCVQDFVSRIQIQIQIRIPE